MTLPAPPPQPRSALLMRFYRLCIISSCIVFFMNRWALFIFFILRQLHENTIQHKIIFANAFIMSFYANYPITWLWNINIHSRLLLKICLVLQNFAHQSPLLKLREMLQRLTECVYQRKAKTAEHLNLCKVYITSVVYLGITNTWLNCVHFQVTVLVQRPLMKECLYLAWRQKNWCHCPSLNIRCLFLPNGSLWRRAFILLEDRKTLSILH